MTKRIIKSTLGLAVLGLIFQQPKTGYDLRKIFATTPMGHFSSSPGAIYPALRRLEEDGLVVGIVDGKDTLRPKRIYTITEMGAEALRQQLSQPVTQNDIVWNMDNLLLRFTFMGDILGRKETVHFLREFLLTVESYIPSLEEHIISVRSMGSPYGAFALEHGLEMYRVHARWARHVIEQLQDDQ